MEKVIEQLFQDASFFRKKRSEKEQHTVFLDTVVPQELEREHQRGKFYMINNPEIKSYHDVP